MRAALPMNPPKVAFYHREPVCGKVGAGDAATGGMTFTCISFGYETQEGLNKALQGLNHNTGVCGSVR